jgi:hypothetical protein
MTVCLAQKQKVEVKFRDPCTKDSTTSTIYFKAKANNYQVGQKVYIGCIVRKSNLDQCSNLKKKWDFT